MSTKIIYFKNMQYFKILRTIDISAFYIIYFCKLKKKKGKFDRM